MDNIIENQSVVVIKFDHASELSGEIKHRLLGLTPRVSDCISVGYSPMIYISKDVQVILMLLVLGPYLENYCSTAVKLNKP